MPHPSSQRPTATPAALRKDLIAQLRANTGARNLWEVWVDFIEMAAIAFSNAVDRLHREQREVRYAAIKRRYSPTELARFRKALETLTDCFEVSGFADVLGSLYMELDLGSKWAGQFFTPYEVSRAMAEIMLAEGLEEKMAAQGYVTVNDPATGAGAMVIALAEALKERGFNPQTQLHATVQDIDLRAAQMAYIQLTLLHIPAVVIVGDSLAVDSREIWYTPAHILGGWSQRLGIHGARAALVGP